MANAISKGKLFMGQLNTVKNKVLIPVKIIELRSHLKVFTGIKKKKSLEKIFSP